MDSHVTATLRMAKSFAQERRSVLGEVWFDRFQTALEQGNLELIHDLIVAGLQLTQSTPEMLETLREVDAEVDTLSHHDLTLH